jgi:glycosyltransferase involved in cell wall biosynthesis
MLILKNKKLHILIVAPFKIPALLYGGTERVIWDLGKTLANAGYQVSFLVKEGSYCDFANILNFDPKKEFNDQIPDDVDLVHFNFSPHQSIKKPYIVTIHGNVPLGDVQDQQSVFVSENHANRYGSQTFVYNGLDWNNYPKPDLKNQRKGFHFLANAAWKVKNLKGAIAITKKANEHLNVLGGYRFNFKMGWRFTLDAHVRFRGMVDNFKKSTFLNQSNGLIFPVLWHEPFGLAVIESLYFGCPVFATPYGSLPELVTEKVGFLSNNGSELASAIQHSNQFNKQDCHDLAQSSFSAQKMTENYLLLYEKVLNGEVLNSSSPQLKENITTRYLPYTT